MNALIALAALTLSSAENPEGVWEHACFNDQARVLFYTEATFDRAGEADPHSLDGVFEDVYIMSPNGLVHRAQLELSGDNWQCLHILLDELNFEETDTTEMETF